MRRFALALYLLCAFGLAWAYWLTLLALGLRVQPGSAVSHLPGLMAPLIGAALASAWEGPKAFAEWLRGLWRWPDRPGLVMALVLAPLVLATGAVVVLAMAGAALPHWADLASYPGLPVDWHGLGMVAAVILLNGYGEEAGWRGYLLPRLLPRWGRIGASLSIAGIWMAWHLPLFWLNSTMAALVGPMLAGWAVALILGTFAMSWLYLVSGGSVLALAVWHVSYNFTVSTPATQGPVAAVVSTAVMLWGAAVVWAWLRRGRQDPQMTRT